MEFSLPTYKISNSSPKENLLVLENLYSELGGFTSTILDEKCYSLSQECFKQHNLIANVLNPDQLKHKWYEANKVDDISSLETGVLRSYRSFVSAQFPLILIDEATKQDSLIAQELATISNLDPFDREAFKMVIGFNKDK